MKPVLSFFVAAALLLPTFLRTALAEERLTPEDYINLLRIDLRAQKAEVVTTSLEMTEAESKLFWPIYNDYNATLAKLNAERIAVLRDFATNYGSIDDAKARDLSRRMFEFTRKRLDLLEKTSHRVEKALSAAFAARFAQIENQLLLMVDVQLASEMPLIPRQTVVSRPPR